MKYRVYLDEAQRDESRKLLWVGQAPTRTLTHALIFLKADRDGYTTNA